MGAILKDVERGIKHWYLPLLVGIVMVGVGVWCIATPVMSYLALSIVFAVSFFTTGVFETVFAIANKAEKWGWSLALGIMSIVVGFVMIANPVLSAVALAFYVGFMLLYYSVTGIVIALSIKDHYDIDWKVLLFVTVIGVVLSLIMLFNPAFAGISIVLWTALTFFVMGFFRIYIAFRLRKVKRFFKDI